MNFTAVLHSALSDPDDPGAGRAEPREPPLDERLEAYARYVAIVAGQLRALRAGDVGRLRELMAERAALESAPGREGDALLARALDALDGRVVEDRELRDHWSRLREEALRATRGLHGVSAHPGRYPEAPAAPARLDLRF